jgi:hypothetical protein
MLVVMPLGYGALEMLDRNGRRGTTAVLVERNFSSACPTHRSHSASGESYRAKDRNSALSQGCPWGIGSLLTSEHARPLCVDWRVQLGGMRGEFDAAYRRSTRGERTNPPAGSLAAPTIRSSTSTASFATGSSLETSATRISKRPGITRGWSGGGTWPSLPDCCFRTRRPDTAFWYRIAQLAATSGSGGNVSL